MTDRKQAQAAYEAFKAKELRLNMARGKPASAQLDLSNGLLDCPSPTELIGEEGEDVRNYGNLQGLLECRQLMADLAGFKLEDSLLYGASTLSLAYDVNVQLLLRPPVDGTQAWYELKDRKVLCLTPGYDRHFQISAGLGFELISVDFLDEGLDIDAIEALVAQDPSIKALWAVPLYSNPSGHCFSAEDCKRLAQMPAAAPDFKIFWDLAYVAHHLGADKAAVPNILELAKEHGHPNRFFAFCSTSKISFAGGGIAALFSSPENLAWFQAQQRLRMINSDKVNQRRHALYFAKHSLKEHMQKHAALLRPKFDAVLAAFDAHFKDSALVHYTRPKGGYFIGLTLPDGLASRVHQLAKEAGITLTPSGATHPYGKNPRDHYLRIAPSYPSLEEISQAAEGLVLCIHLAMAEKA